MTFQPDVPVELADGTLVCGKHHQIVCGYCCCDYSFMQEEDPITSEDEESLTPEARPEDYETLPNLRARSIASQMRPRPPIKAAERFYPPGRDDTPQSLFQAGISRRATPPICRFIRQGNRRELLIYTDGACLANGRESSKAGWSFVFHPFMENRIGYCSSRLELKGPTSETQPQTSNRAELRAIIGALGFREWYTEDWDSLVIATDSEYAVKGLTEYVTKWLKNGWRTSSGSPVKNQDLWKYLLDRLSHWEKEGLRVRFWHIPREWNIDADRRAKAAAERDDPPEDFWVIPGALV